MKAQPNFCKYFNFSDGTLELSHRVFIYSHDECDDDNYVNRKLIYSILLKDVKDRIRFISPDMFDSKIMSSDKKVIPDTVNPQAQHNFL